MSNKVAIGIDLGTTYSCVAVFANGKVEIIANDMGSRITPSCVAFTNLERLIGEAAVSQADVNPRYTIFEAKRLIGRRFIDPIVQRDIKQWPFKVCNTNGAPTFKVQYKSEEKIFTPEQISSMVLSKMKETAETFVHGEVTDAVISVPAYFTDSQRQATKDAGEVAGLNVLNIINEPTAAAIAYGVDKTVTFERNILIYDLGGGTFDVAIMSIADGVFDVKAIGGDTHLGGGDFDNRLLKYFMETISRKNKVDLSTNWSAMGKLRSACEAAKRGLSSALKVNLDIACLFDGNDFRSTITRTRFENLCLDLFQQTLKHVTTTLEDSGLSKDDIHEVVLVGGSTRIPKIQQLLQDFFSGKMLNKTINPDEAVAYGAAIKAAILSGDKTVDEVKLIDVTPLTLSTDNPDGTITPVIKRSTRIPAKATVRRTTVYDYQTRVKFNIYEGEDTHCERNLTLGSFQLDNIESAPAAVPYINLTYEIDENGILHASAIDQETSCANGITIISNKGRLNRKEIDRMIAEAVEFKNDDVEHARRDSARLTLEKYCFDTINVVDEAVDGISDSSREALRRECMVLLEWIDEHDDACEQEHVQKLEYIKDFCEPMLASVQLTALTLFSS